MNVLALIPARGGSKRLPGKNIRMLGGKPLLAWSIASARGFPEIRDILVSTDDGSIADAAKNEGALIPWLRPAELATDSATSVDVGIHAVDWYEKHIGKLDGLLLLQPTCPFRSAETMARGLRLFVQSNHRTVVGIAPAKSHPLWCLKVEGNSIRPYVQGGGLHLRSQDLPPAYVVTGSFYLISPEELRRRRSFFGDSALPLVIEHPMECIDIDTDSDWKIAEAFLSSGLVV
jgi:CMP-N,N'-diacetyllegionaminic acid synthase